MKSISKRLLKQFKNGSQWQHKVSQEVVWILETIPETIVGEHSQLFIMFITQDGCRKQLDHEDFLEYYTAIPTMKGAYH